MCGCKSETVLAQCRHKERLFERCLAYQLREQGSCLASCVPSCNAQHRKYRTDRVCRDCLHYFHETYGKDQYLKFIQHFLDYKESMGWGTTAIDPRTVPRALLLNRQAAPAGVQGVGRGRGQGQPFQPHQPMMPAVHEHISTPSHVPNIDKPLPADPSLFAVGDDSDDDDCEYADQENDKGNPYPSTLSPQAKYSTGSLPLNVSVVPELAYLAQGRHSSSHNSSSTSIELAQPVAKRQQGVSVAHKAHIGSLVEKLTTAAKEMDVPNIEYFEYDGMYVPRIETPPRSKDKGRGKGKQRMSSPAPSPPPSPLPSLSSLSSLRSSPMTFSPGPPPSSARTSAIDIAIAADDVPASLIPGRGRAGSDAAESMAESPSTYFVMTQPDANSPTGSSARVRNSPSRESVAVPPPRRLDGVLIPPVSACPHGHHHDHDGPCAGEDARGKGDEKAEYFQDQCQACRGCFFKERGLPSEMYIRAECRSATFSRSPPSGSVLVSVSVPKRRYSCAVQSCYCEDDGKGEKCPSCRERDVMVGGLNMTWI
ncbi:hypothetical protein F5Y14DRAFT_428044 [Nemania sp. NC0429]|nr:hypothetical protein F5Y14DRAFT_428044 [Nemania sp. NC0429]